MPDTRFITEFDQYLFGQGTHYDLYNKLGAHPMTVDGEEGVAQPASRIKDKRPGGRAYGILDCGTPPVLWSSQGVVTNPCQPGLTSCDAEAGTSHRPFALRQSRTLP